MGVEFWQAGRMSYDLAPACRELIDAQAGVFTRRQALDSGMPPSAIDRRLRGGRWLTLHQGVYAAFTGIPPRQAVLWAAVLRVGPEAALSHHSAAELFRLLDKPVTPIHVTIPHRRRVRAVAGMVIHRSHRFEELVHPSLVPPRTRIDDTVLDLVAQAPTFEVAFGFVCAASQRRLTTPEKLMEAMGRRTKLRWREDMAKALHDIAAGAHSMLEYRYLHRVERPHGLPVATRQARLSADGRSRYLDNLYAEYGLCVELDGLQAHPDDQRWQDLRRVNAIAEVGVTVLRYGWVDVDRTPCQVARQVAIVLRRMGWPGSARYCGASCGARPQQASLASRDARS
jgi:very-short-patch-repair endonuclease